MPDSLPTHSPPAMAGLHHGSALDVELRVTVFGNFAAAEKIENAITLRDLVPHLLTTERASKADLPWLKLASFGDSRTNRGSLRHDANMTAIYGVEADYDGGQITLDRARQILRNAGLAAVVYTSPSHTAQTPRWRILCPASRALPPEARDALLARLNGLFVGALAAESFTRSQSYYFGHVPGATDHTAFTVEGRAIDTAQDLDADAIGRPKPAKAPSAPVSTSYQPSSAEGHPWALKALARECEAIRHASDGNKHHALNRAAYSIGGFVAGGSLPEGEAFADLAAALNSIRDRCADFRHAEKTLRTAFEDGKKEPRGVPEPTAMPEQRVPFGIGSAAGPLDYDPETGEVLDVPASVAAPDPALLPLVYFDDVKPNLDVQDFVEGLLTTTAMSVVYGPSNCGKTFFMTDLGLHIAAGWMWRGREIDAGGVIYCALEGGHGISNRVAAFKAHHGILGGLPFAVVPVAINLLDPNADRDKLAATVRAAAAHMGRPVVLVVIDTLSRALAGGNENAPDDMGALVASADYIRAEVQAHVCFIHHSGKDQAAGARGHSLLRAATDTEIEISRESATAPSIAKVTKQRDLEIEGQFVFTLKAVEMGKNRRGKPVTSCIVETVEGEAAVQKRRLPSGMQAGMTALEEAVIKAGRPGQHPDMPDNVRVVPLSTWRHVFYSRSSLENQEAKQKAFKRASTDLQSAQLVGVRDDHAWIARASE